jgi:hypothetical protein
MSKDRFEPIPAFLQFTGGSKQRKFCHSSCTVENMHLQVYTNAKHFAPKLVLS